MKYAVYCIQNHNEIKTINHKKLIKGSVYTYFSKSNEKFYYICHSKKGILNLNWRRGAEIKNIPELNFLKNNPVNSFKQIRREDFKKIIIALMKIQKKEFELIHLNISDANFTLLFIENENIYSQKYSISSKKILLSKFSHLILNYFNNDIIKNNQEFTEVKKYIKKHLKDFSHLLQIKNKLKHFNKVVLSSTSYHNLAALSIAFFINNFIYLTLTNRKHKNNFLNYNKSIRRILIITNLNGKPLSNLLNAEIFKTYENANFSIKHISGTFSYDRFSQLFDENYNLKYDLIIYRGHAYIENKKICWPAKEKNYILKSHMVNYMIHLGCIPITEKNELSELPFYSGIMPYSLLPDKNYTNFILQILKYIKKGFTFSMSCKKSFLKYKEENFLFGYWVY
ncbi:MAG: hypothetical protein OEZ22_10160 [Spirochaetia bacterium]|nr:hypothetical protein [Spirochaetia bacterium]